MAHDLDRPVIGPTVHGLEKYADENVSAKSLSRKPRGLPTKVPRLATFAKAKVLREISARSFSRESRTWLRGKSEALRLERESELFPQNPSTRHDRAKKVGGPGGDFSAVARSTGPKWVKGTGSGRSG
ncbi:hypothetical protein KM043_004051 [Ampulex compressa]|nr:hypothetical protein KM043_004051 [Ampulex compressa]